MSQTIELAQTAKRDYLQALEQQYQARWREERVFEVNAPPPEELAGLAPAQIHQKYPKWFGTFPFPYMNGSLHLGHAFTISKIEFAAGYQRMLGKRVLFPHGFHVTGMPIKASADKIIREIEMFGPDFERYEQVQAELDAADAATEAAEVAEATVDKSKAKKGKLVAKSTGHTYQFQIMESIGIPRAEIKKFADPYHWLTVFPPIAIEDHNTFGSRIDWRRTFLTTDANPYFDAFVRWQVNKLHKLGKIKFGERYTIYSPKDGQPCMDHDRQDGEGFGPQEYTAVKMEVVQWSPAAKEAIESKVGGRKVFLVAATLRPETMYGQTNCYVGTAMKYGVFAMNDKEAFVCTHRAARNMAFQGIPATRGSVDQLVEISGDKLIGTKIKAPFAINPEVYVLPMDNVLATKGTGVVTSVPSDSPDDCATLFDLRKKAAFYKIDPSWAAIDPVPVISTPTYGDLCAPTLLQQLKIQSQKDTKQLAEAKELAYKEGFYNGTMLVGEFKGQSVQDAKPKVRERMIEAGLAFAYAEPEGLVISRSADECVVALMDQWYLDYGEESWRAQVERLIAKMNLYTPETRHAFEKTLAWLNKWACARTYGLGSKLPWDPQFLVESLSDSTIYMSYYTVAQLLHESSIDGSRPGPLGITADQMTDEIWEYVFCDGPFPDPSPLAREKADALKHEYKYFYPFDIRSSAKDLVPNHLTFCLYNHAAILPEDKFPLSMRTNGHLLLNGKKMSKSAGNFLTLRDGIKKFGADATRLSLADAGDGMEDANFEEKTANANILRVHTLLGWCEDMVKEEANLRHGPRNYHDDVFEHEMNELINITQSHYEATNYKDAVKYGFYEYQSARDWYREVTSDVGMHADLVQYWMRTAALLIAPIAPHFAEHIYSTILKSPTSIQRALWPTPDKPVKKEILEVGAYMRGTIKMIRDAEASLVKMLQKAKGKKSGAPAAVFDPKKPKSVNIYVATAFPEWQDVCVQAVKEAYAEEADKVDDAKVRDILTEKGLIKDKRAMPFVQAFKKRMAQFGAQTAFRRTLPFSEMQVLKEILPYLKKTLGLVDAEVMSVEEARTKEGQPGYSKNIMDTSEPGAPAFEYRNLQHKGANTFVIRFLTDLDHFNVAFIPLFYVIRLCKRSLHLPSLTWLRGKGQAHPCTWSKSVRRVVQPQGKCWAEEILAGSPQFIVAASPQFIVTGPSPPAICSWFPIPTSDPAHPSTSKSHIFPTLNSQVQMFDHEDDTYVLTPSSRGSNAHTLHPYPFSNPSQSLNLSSDTTVLPLPRHF
ncbi:putative class-I aminoacyl-tRNA synthetase family protein [Lyophyllum shimeji]|uniref:leucine--tRNA ligase n=1 Tax=Lyophyllum shimeji TaxID=47721 RepID=A0A9P3PZ32_LYOSH|nr:putative class-I aminoacyl-tRNA synthetase family protein [Lyophyllum shimeji]